MSTYFPEGVAIAKALDCAGSAPRCLMGLANVDNGFIAGTTSAEARRCAFSGVPAATEMPSAQAYVRQYQRMFAKRPGVWGSFTYDSAHDPLRRDQQGEELRVRRRAAQSSAATRDHRGATGAITIDRQTGYRTTVPVSILRVDSSERFVIAR